MSIFSNRHSPSFFTPFAENRPVPARGPYPLFHIFIDKEVVFMDEIRIESLRWYPSATAQQLSQYKQALIEADRADLLLVPDPTDSSWHLGLLLSRCYTQGLRTCIGVRGVSTDGTLHCLQISSASVRGFASSLMRRLNAPSAVSVADADTAALDFFADTPPQSPAKNTPAPSDTAALRFLQAHTPAQLQRELSEHVIGQQALTREVAGFLYYHAMRQVHPNLPPRPMLISGPSGSGKTEVWRAAARLYGRVFPIKVIDGSNLSCEGWAGNYKLDTYIDAAMANGGILVVDEFDKLTRPKHSSSGDNVSLDIQAEFLKLMEGEYLLTEKRKQTGLSSRQMGFVLVGAFESLRAEKEQPAQSPARPIGFCAEAPAVQPKGGVLTDGDFIAYGIMPEIVGRIAVKCATQPLPDRAYLDILRGPHSRVAQLEQVLRAYGIAAADVISDQALLELVRSARSNRTGVRWVSAQVENRLLEAIYGQGVGGPPAQAS